MDEEVVNRFLKSSRKARKQATCYPCQRRKVKCDRGSPCKVCVARGHSFLCSYGRQSEGSSTSPPEIMSNKESPTTISGDAASIEASDISLLRTELDKLRHEVHQARARHRRCQATQLVARRLRARCKEFEATYASLKAGNWAALARLDRMMDRDLDADDESVTCSYSPDDSESAIIASSRKHDQSLRDSRVSSQQHLFMAQSEAGQQSTADANTQREWHRPLTVSKPPQSMALDMQNLRLSRNLAIDIPNQASSLNSSLSAQVASAIQGSHRLTNDDMNPLLPGAVVGGEGQSTHTHMIPTQHQSTPSLLRPKECFTMSAAYPSTAAPIASKYTEQGSIPPSRPQCPVEIESPDVMQSLLVPSSIKMFPDSFWVHNGSYPPMAFTQYTDLMERSYADYCSRILVNTQE